jgi:hypothetical protein
MTDGGGQQQSGWNRSEEALAFAFIPGFYPIKFIYKEKIRG